MSYHIVFETISNCLKSHFLAHSYLKYCQSHFQFLSFIHKLSCRHSLFSLLKLTHFSEHHKLNPVDFLPFALTHTCTKCLRNMAFMCLCAVFYPSPLEPSTLWGQRLEWFSPLAVVLPPEWRGCYQMTGGLVCMVVGISLSFRAGIFQKCNTFAVSHSGWTTLASTRLLGLCNFHTVVGFALIHV